MALPAAPLRPAPAKLRGAMGTPSRPPRQAFLRTARATLYAAGYVAPPVPPSTSQSSRRTLRVASLALLALLLLPHCATNGADEIAALQRENARLRGEIEALRGELAGRPAAAAESATAPQLEQVFVPRSRVSVEVTQTAGTGKTSVASLWYRTVDAGPLPRMEWLQVRAEQSAAGSLTGAWLLIERKAGRGSVETEAARLTIDGRVVELRQASYEANRAAGQTPGRVASGQKQERASFALPDGALGQVATAISVHFEAGAVAFDLSDEHLAAFAAVAARVGAAQGAGGSR